MKRDGHIPANSLIRKPQVNFREISINNSTRLDRPANYIFAINVIEHVPGSKFLIFDALKLKTLKGARKIICPTMKFRLSPILTDQSFSTGF